LNTGMSAVGTGASRRASRRSRTMSAGCRICGANGGSRHGWPGLKAVGRIEAVRELKGRTERAVRTCIMSAEIPPERLLELTRNHWRIENCLHWVLDVVMGEDRMRNGPECLAAIRRIALNIVRLMDDEHSLKGRMDIAGWNDEYLAGLFVNEACGSARRRGRELQSMGFEVRPVPPIHVKPFVKRHKNDAADAEAVCEAAIDDPETRLPETVRDLGRELLEQVGILDAKIGKLDAEVRKRAKESDEAKRLTAIPGIGPICAMAIQAFAPPMEGFRRGRDFPAWLGLVTRRCSTGGKPKLGRISKMGQCDLRRLLIAGAIAVIRWASRRGTDDPWPAALLTRKPPMPAAAALANKMARMVWAVATTKEIYRAPASARETGGGRAAGTNVEMKKEFFRGSTFA